MTILFFSYLIILDFITRLQQIFHKEMLFGFFSLSSPKGKIEKTSKYSLDTMDLWSVAVSGIFRRPQVLRSRF